MCQVRLLAGEMALAAGEVGIAEHLALALASARYEPAWRLAAALGAPYLHHLPELEGWRLHQQRLQHQEPHQDQQQRNGVANAVETESLDPPKQKRQQAGEWQAANGQVNQAEEEGLHQAGQLTQQQEGQHEEQQQQQQRGSAAKRTSQIGEGSRLSLLAFAVCHCPGEELAPLTDELLECQTCLEAKPRNKGAAVAAAGCACADEVLAAAAAGAPTHRQEQLMLAGAAAAADGRSALDGLPALGDPHLLLAALLAGGSVADAEERLTAVLDCSSAPGAGGEGAAASYGRLQRLLTVGAAAHLLLALGPSAAEVAASGQLPEPADMATEVAASRKLPKPADKAAEPAVSVTGSVGGIAPSTSVPARRQLLAARVAELMGVAKRLKEDGSLTDVQEAAADAADRCFQRLRQAADSRHLREALPLVEPARFIGGEGDTVAWNLFYVQRAVMLRGGVGWEV